MKVLMISKACVVGAYQRKLEELASRPEMELLVIVPPYWREETRWIPLERLHTRGYRLEVEHANFNGHFHMFHFPRLARHIRSFRPDIVHIDEEPYNLATWHALRSASRWGARSVFFTWQNLYRRYPPPFRWMEQHCFRAVDRAIAGNAEAAKILQRKGFDKPVDIIPQFGVDPEIFQPVPDLTPPTPLPHGGRGEQAEDTPFPGREGGRGVRSGTPHSPFHIGYVGRLVEQKGILDLVEAVAGMDDDCHLVLIGAGPFRSSIEERAVALGMSHRLKIVAAVPSREMPAIMNGLDLLVLPSRTRSNWKEQFGRALVEAMACQVPVVGSDSGEIPNVIGDAGLVFPEGNVEALASHLKTLRASPDLRRELGEKGRARVLAHFTQARVAEQTYQVYRQMLR